MPVTAQQGAAATGTEGRLRWPSSHRQGWCHSSVLMNSGRGPGTGLGKRLDDTGGGPDEGVRLRPDDRRTRGYGGTQPLSRALDTAVSCKNGHPAVTVASAIAGSAPSGDRLTQLEVIRTSLVRTVLEIRAACEAATGDGHRPDRDLPDEGWTVQQQLLSAAIQDLNDLDGFLHELRTHTGSSPAH